MAMAIVTLVRTDLMTTWQRQLPADVPNHFAINVLPHQVTGFQTFMGEKNIDTSQLYPMIRGR